MRKAVLRLGNYCAEAIPHICISGSRDVFVNGKPVCRQGDSFTEGKILTNGSKIVFANGFGVGRIGDPVSCGFKVISGSSNVFCD
ncbi:MAG: PAAR domain-containing protein [Wolbachia endosymbiont of Tyrophagus putrescentiae]|nr:PAAR domain-containing protein [Wolbachia endosymbiont of Tyrophagus putrescentiae]MDN5248972.1 PAAR domain-containing protein [Alphaproteobacteria bacterium]